jgi:hypothetical protein
MPVRFFPATAEQVIAVIEAVYINGEPTGLNFIEIFTGLSKDQAENALNLAVDLGLLSLNSSNYNISNFLCRYASISKLDQAVALLRIVLESYKPFLTFRRRLIETEDVAKAVRDTKAILDLDADHETIKNTLINLGTFSDSIKMGRGGRCEPKEAPLDNALRIIADSCEELVAAELRITEQIGRVASELSREDIIVPLSDALLKSSNNHSADAIRSAGNAVESFLDYLAGKLSISLAGTGINSKLNDLHGKGKLPTKLQNVGFYLGHIRNAANHGTDTEVNASWKIRPDTAVEYVFVACSFIAAVSAFNFSNSVEI